jgi:hypothetical protein
MLAKNMTTTFAFALLAEESDWSWIPNAPNTSTVAYGSQLMVGNYNSTPFLNPSNPTPLVIKSEAGKS